MSFLNTGSHRYKSLDDWLQAEVRLYKFCVFLFYRGEWCPSCWEYIALFNEAASHIRTKGGEFFLVVPKAKADRKKMEKCAKLEFKVISDPEGELASKYKITVTVQEKKEGRLSALLERAGLRSSSSPLTKCRSMSIPPLYEGYKISHPGVVILSAVKQEDTFRTNSTIKNHYACKEYLTPGGLNDLLEMHFGHARTSARTFC